MHRINSTHSVQYPKSLHTQTWLIPVHSRLEEEHRLIIDMMPREFCKGRGILWTRSIDLLKRHLQMTMMLLLEVEEIEPATYWV